MSIGKKCSVASTRLHFFKSFGNLAYIKQCHFYVLNKKWGSKYVTYKEETAFSASGNKGPRITSGPTGGLEKKTRHENFMKKTSIICTLHIREMLTQ